MLRKYHYHPDVLQLAVKSFNLSAALINAGLRTPPTSSELVDCVLSILSSFNWKEHYSEGSLLIDMTNSLFVCFPQSFSPECFSQLATIYCTAVDTNTYNGLTRPAIVVGRMFPVVFPDAVFRELNTRGVHKKLRELLPYYNAMEEEEVASILEPLQQFISACPYTAPEYIEESLHLLLLFAAQRFPTSLKVQVYLWQAQMRLCQNAPQFLRDLDGPTLAMAILTVLQEQVKAGVSTTPVVRFLGVCSGTFPTIMIPTCLNNPELIHIFLGILDTSREVNSKEEEEELIMVSRFLALLCARVQNQPTLELIVQYGIVRHLKEATLKWQLLCALPTRPFSPTQATGTTHP